MTENDKALNSLAARTAQRIANIQVLKVSALNLKWWIAFSQMVARRTRDQRLPQVASSLTFTTVLALVPMVTVALAVFTAFPIFDRFRDALQNYLIESFFPETLSNLILTYVNQFASKAKGLTAVGIVVLVITSLTTMFTVDKVFNEIWHVKRSRSLVKKIVLYWSVITLSPILIGASIWSSSYVLKLSLSGLDGGQHVNAFVLSLMPMAFTVVAFAMLYVTIPNRPVRFKDAAIGGGVAAVLFEVFKRGFAYYITHFPTYTLVYGAMAAVPIFLLWIYLSWIIVLLGATVVAALPIARTGHWAYQEKPGERWLFSLRILSELEKARRFELPGLTVDELRLVSDVPPDALDDLLIVLMGRGFIASVVGGRGAERYAMVCDPSAIPVAAVATAVWFDPSLIESGAQCLPEFSRSMKNLSNEFLDRPVLMQWLQTDTPI